MGVDLWWLPVGAGGHVVVHTSRWWESLRAMREHRTPQDLFHAALEVRDATDRFVIEMAPAWGLDSVPRGVVASGPVGARALARSRVFRYEVRCWRDGTIPDIRFAVESPRHFDLTPSAARALIDRVATIPRLTWGRDAYGISDMWNSNSLVAWLLATSGIDAATVQPPRGGSAPGWRSGVLAAARRTA